MYTLSAIWNYNQVSLSITNLQGFATEWLSIGNVEPVAHELWHSAGTNWGGEMSGGECLGDMQGNCLKGNVQGGGCLDPMQEFVCVVVMICTVIWLTDTDTQTAFDRLYYYLSQVS